MCLLLLAHHAHDDYPLVVAANRDEFHSRPTEPAGWWRSPRILAGRDRLAGGTWMAIARDGRWGAVTNYRSPQARRQQARSRGELVPKAVGGEFDREEGWRSLLERVHEYNGFNLLFGSRDGLRYVSDRSEEPQELSAGIYGLSNHSLDTDWPKVRRGRNLLRHYLQSSDLGRIDPLFGLLADRNQPADECLPDTGVPREWERVLAPILIVDRAYGTRSSSVLLVHRTGDVRFAERRLDPEGRAIGTKLFRFTV